jgi:hypothetical protein
MRKPRTLTWKSSRPQDSSRPSARHRARSPVRYSRAPAPRRTRPGRSAPPSGPAAPVARAPPAPPPMYSSPARPPAPARPRRPAGRPALGAEGPSGTDAPASSGVAAPREHVTALRWARTGCSSHARAAARVKRRTSAAAAPRRCTHPAQAGAALHAGASRNSCSMEGTRRACDARADDSGQVAGSRCPSGRAITSRAPRRSGQKSSQTETSKPDGSSAAPRRRAHPQRRATRQPVHHAACATITPLGSPVEPRCR